MWNRKERNSWIRNGILIVAVVILYATGVHVEVLGFMQRGLLATGLMDPDIGQATPLHGREDRNALPADMVDADMVDADYSLNLLDIEGNTLSMEELKGRVIFLNMWATWCPPCIAEMPGIEKLHREIGDQVEFVMVSVDKDFETAKAFTERKGYGLPIYSAVRGLPEMYQGSAIPATYVIDAQGHLVMSHVGIANYHSSEFKEFLLGLK